jgi:kinesin family protein 7
VQPLVAACFKGYNATVFAYGQTGSGKTHTMGTVGVSATVEEDQGIIPRALADIFNEVNARSCSADISVRVSFLEIYNENIRDLLDHSPAASSKSISIRDDAAGNVKVLGASEISVSSCSDMVRHASPCLARRESAFITEFGF